MSHTHAHAQWFQVGISTTFHCRSYNNWVITNSHPLDEWASIFSFDIPSYHMHIEWWSIVYFSKKKKINKSRRISKVENRTSKKKRGTNKEQCSCHYSFKFSNDWKCIISWRNLGLFESLHGFCFCICFSLSLSLCSRSSRSDITSLLKQLPFICSPRQFCSVSISFSLSCYYSCAPLVM